MSAAEDPTRNPDRYFNCVSCGVEVFYGGRPGARIRKRGEGGITVGKAAVVDKCWACKFYYGNAK